MKRILVLGAGRSCTVLISYLVALCKQKDWQLTVAEKEVKLAKEKLPDSPGFKAIYFDITDTTMVDEVIAQHDLVISMLPARFHILAARACATHGKHFLTASYVNEEINALNLDFVKSNKILLMETGLDPGIDHMSAMKVLDHLKEQGADLLGFETFTGGLLADDREKDNPWEYKFTWNPRNVVLAGQGYVKFIQERRYKYIPYHRLFSRTEIIHIPGYGYFEGYANRDSLKYLDLYNLRGINTLFRGTLRRKGFCKSWDVFVQLGATDDTYLLENVSKLTHRQFLNTFLQYNPHDSVELKLAHYLNVGMEDEIMYKLKWLGMFDDELVGLEQGTPAQILEHILKKSWTLNDSDRDMVVMWHKFDYELQGEKHQIQSHMVAIGDDDTNTAMAKTVGLPLAIAAKLILTDQIQLSGVQLPTRKELYMPILYELASFGFDFSEREVAIR